MRFLASHTGLALATLVSLGLTAPATHAQTAFTAGDLVVSQEGSGAATLSSAATQVYLDEFSTTGGAAVQQFAVTGLTNSGTATSEGALTLSSTGNVLLIAGYNTAAGTAGAVASSTSSGAANNRGVAEITAAGAVSTSFFNDGTYSGNNIRSATSTDGTTIYATGAAGGVTTATFNANGSTTTTTAETGATNTRIVNLFGGNTYFSSFSGTYKGIYQDGATSAATPTLIAADGSSGGAYDFFFANASTLYVADNSNGIEKFTAGTNGVFGNGTVIGAAQSGLTGLTGITNAAGVTTLYTVSPTNLLSITDNGAGASSTYTTLATAATNEAFRGVDFAPTANAGTVPASPEPAQTAGIGFFIVGLAGLILKARKRTAAEAT